MSDIAAPDAREVHAALVSAYCRNLPATLGTGIVLATIYLITQWSTCGHGLMAGWYGALLAVTLVRVRIWQRFRRLPGDATDDLSSLATPLSLTVLLSGLVWGSAAWLLYSEGDVAARMALALALAGVTAGASTNLTAHRTAAMGFHLAVLLPLITRMALTGGSANLGMTLMTCLYLVYLLVTVNRLYRQIRDNLVLSLEAERRELTLRDSERRYRLLAHTDALTGLPNRHALQRLLPDLIAAAGPEGHLAVLYLDADNFKDFNDMFGHGFGDRILVLLAERLRGCLTAGDIVARVGGDEFVIVAPSMRSADAADAFAVKVLAALAAPAQVDGTSLLLCASIGISHYPQDGCTGEELFKRADIALYRAKASGRNCFQRFTPDMAELLRERLFLENELRTALAEGQLYVDYQPLVELRSSRRIELEALVRWRHPQRGLMSPATFIPVAEHCGLMDRVGEYVLQAVCRQQREWLDQMLPVVPIAINVSPRQFDSGRLVRIITEATTQHDVDPALLQIEITETCLMQNRENIVQTLEQLRTMGIRISVDDFGTGYSSLSYLKLLPLDTLKIDRCFVRDMTRDERDLSLVRGIVGIAHSLSLRIVAEGVETPRQLALLRELGCDVAQGYFFHRPLDVAQCTELLRGTSHHLPQLHPQAEPPESQRRLPRSA